MAFVINAYSIGNSCIRRDFINKTTTDLCLRNSKIVIEDLNVKGMMANHCLAKAVSDVGFYEFRRQLTYKSLIYGTDLLIADRWYASSPTCSGCGNKNKDLTLKDRTYSCSNCCLILDRDFNAAKNLASLAKTKELTSGNTGDNITLPVANGNVKSVELEAVGPTRKQKLNKTISNFSDYD